MVTVKTVYECLDKIAPYALSESYDNSGLQCGDLTQTVTGILLCVDCTEAVVEEAAALGCELIVSHHPLIFPQIRSISEQDGVGRVLRQLIRKDIALISAHTNLDIVETGVCDAMADLVGLENRESIEKESGYGRVGDIEPTTVYELAKKCAAVFEGNNVRFTGEGDRVVSRIALASGSGTGCAENALALGAQCLITGDVKYSQGFDFLRKGLSMIDAGHYDTEKVILPRLCNRLQTELAGVKWNVKLLITSKGKDVFTKL
ncbi:MAG: Nif3-like dinuclear metal center hexameric protein [Clostridia bacterium]|nr:Nif3-like dinuclear metal center hexameric protein [Clostridia bacterium]